jgi:hypothetical protein
MRERLRLWTDLFGLWLAWLPRKALSSSSPSDPSWSSLSLSSSSMSPRIVVNDRFVCEATESATAEIAEGNRLLERVAGIWARKLLVNANAYRDPGASLSRLITISTCLCTCASTVLTPWWRSYKIVSRARARRR